MALRIVLPERNSTSSNSSGAGVGRGWTISQTSSAANPTPPWFRNSTPTSSTFSSKSHAHTQPERDLVDDIQRFLEEISELSRWIKQVASSHQSSAQKDNERVVDKINKARSKLKGDKRTIEMALTAHQRHASSNNDPKEKAKYERLRSAFQKAQEQLKSLEESWERTTRTQRFYYPVDNLYDSNTTALALEEERKQKQMQLARDKSEDKGDIIAAFQAIARKNISGQSSELDRAIAEDTCSEMERINGEIVFLTDTYREVSSMVGVQGDEVDNIEKHISDAQNNVGDGTVELAEAARKQVKRSGYVMKGAAGGAVVGGIAIGAAFVPLGLAYVLSGVAVGGAMGGVSGGVVGSKVATVQQRRLNKFLLEEFLMKSEKAKHWTPLEDANECAHCKKDFLPVVRKRHRCRDCGGVYCNSCSDFKRRIHIEGAPSSLDTRARVCIDCINERRYPASIFPTQPGPDSSERSSLTETKKNENSLSLGDILPREGASSNTNAPGESSEWSFRSFLSGTPLSILAN